MGEFLLGVFFASVVIGTALTVSIIGVIAENRKRKESHDQKDDE